MKAASVCSVYVWVLLLCIHTYCNFLFADIREFLRLVAVRGRVLCWSISVFNATRIAPARYYATILLT